MNDAHATGDSVALTATEVEQLAAAEAIIADGIAHALAGSIQVGHALARIRDQRLYVHGHDTFDAYCRERWDMRRESADRLIRVADTAAALGAAGLPLPQSQRALLALAPYRDDAAELARLSQAGGTAPAIGAATKHACLTDLQAEYDAACSALAAGHASLRLPGTVADAEIWLGESFRLEANVRRAWARLFNADADTVLAAAQDEAMVHVLETIAVSLIEQRDTDPDALAYVARLHHEGIVDALATWRDVEPDPDHLVDDARYGLALAQAVTA